MTFIQKIETAVFLWFIWALAGCHDLNPKATAVVDCRVHAVAPYVGDAYDAEELVREALAGKTNPLQVAAALGAKLEDLQALAKAWNACTPDPEPEPTETVQARIVAPPPAYGNKVL